MGLFKLSIRSLDAAPCTANEKLSWRVAIRLGKKDANWQAANIPRAVGREHIYWHAWGILILQSLQNTQFELRETKC
jgi:hypothetical protein